MRERCEQRLKELKTQLEKGQRMLADLEAKQSHLKGTMLRISGAIQVLEELLAQTPMDYEVISRSQRDVITHTNRT